MYESEVRAELSNLAAGSGRVNKLETHHKPQWANVRRIISCRLSCRTDASPILKFEHATLALGTKVEEVEDFASKSGFTSH